MSDQSLKRAVEVRMPSGETRRIETVGEALRWIDQTVGDDPRWFRTRMTLLHAADDGSLRRIRAATRAFAEAVGTGRD